MNLDRIFDAVCSREEFLDKYRYICEAVPPDAMISIYTCECCDRPHLSVSANDNLPHAKIRGIQRKLRELFNS